MHSVSVKCVLWSSLNPLADEKDRAEEILEGSHEGIILTNMRGEMQQINAAAAAMFQWPMAEMVCRVACETIPFEAPLCVHIHPIQFLG